MKVIQLRYCIIGALLRTRLLTLHTTLVDTFDWKSQRFLKTTGSVANNLIDRICLSFQPTLSKRHREHQTSRHVMRLSARQAFYGFQKHGLLLSRTSQLRNATTSIRTCRTTRYRVAAYGMFGEPRSSGKPHVSSTTYCTTTTLRTRFALLVTCSSYLEQFTLASL
jgi:hypothetical protein